MVTVSDVGLNKAGLFARASPGKFLAKFLRDVSAKTHFGRLSANKLDVMTLFFILKLLKESLS